MVYKQRGLDAQQVGDRLEGIRQVRVVNVTRVGHAEEAAAVRVVKVTKEEDAEKVLPLSSASALSEPTTSQQLATRQIN